MGLNIPTVVTVLLAIGLTIVLVDKSSAPETDSITGFVLWLIKSVAWVLAVVAVFLPLLAWNIHRVGRRDRSEQAQLRLDADSTVLKDDQMKWFLKNSLSDSSYGVAKCYAFGSVVGHYPTRDVDVIIQFNTSNKGQVRIYRDRLRNIESNFQEFYHVMLHVQTFLSTDDEDLAKFLDDAGRHERLL